MSSTCFSTVGIFSLLCQSFPFYRQQIHLVHRLCWPGTWKFSDHPELHQVWLSWSSRCFICGFLICVCCGLLLQRLLLHWLLRPANIGAYGLGELGHLRNPNRLLQWILNFLHLKWILINEVFYADLYYLKLMNLHFISLHSKLDTYKPLKYKRDR